MDLRKLSLSKCLVDHASLLLTIPLIPLNCTFGVVNEKKAISFQAALKNESKRLSGNKTTDAHEVSIVFLVRKPGCAGCREHGLQLTSLVKEFPNNNLSLWAIVKDTGVDEEGVLSFYQDFFHFPIYKDEKWQSYKAMGERKLTLTQYIQGYLTNKSRWDKMGIHMSRAKCRDGWVQGGVLFFQNNKLMQAYEEDFGKELEMDVLRATINRLQRDNDDDDDATTSISLSDDSDSSFTQERTEI